MKALAVFPAQRAIQLIDRAPPNLHDPADVLLRVLDVGICGTDREIVAFDYGLPPPGEDFLVIGHEAVAEVIAVGHGVTQLRPGDLVVPTVRRPCSVPTCRPCRSGNQDFCVTGDFRERGIKELHGFMTEYIVEHERNLHVVPQELREFAVLAEPLSIAEKGIEQVWTIQSRLPWGDVTAPVDQRGRGLNAVVIGAGPVGLLGAMLLIAQGFTTYVYSHGDAPNPRSEIVTALGATYLSPLTTPSIAAIPRQIGSLDLVYEAVGSSSLALAVLQGLSANGIFVFTGVPALAEHKTVDFDRIMRQLVLNNQVSIGTVNAGDRAYAAAIRDLARFAQNWPEQLRALITDRFPLAAAASVLINRPPGIKQVIAVAAPPAER